MASDQKAIYRQHDIYTTGHQFSRALTAGAWFNWHLRRMINHGTVEKQVVNDKKRLFVNQIIFPATIEIFLSASQKFMTGFGKLSFN